MKDKLMNDLKEAMRNKDTISKNTIQMVRAQLLLKEKELQRELDENEIIEVIQKEKKQREKALVDFKKANREDLIKQTQEEIAVLDNYLPTQLTSEELYEKIKIDMKEIAEDLSASFGDLVKAFSSLYKSYANGKTIAEVAKRITEERKENKYER